MGNRKGTRGGLRRWAEKKANDGRRDVSGMSADDVRQLVHELEVHCVEIELQNEELRRIQDDLQESRDLYLDLYDNAPVGYFTLSTGTNVIVEANLTACDLLGMDRASLKGTVFTRYLDPARADLFHHCWRKALERGNNEHCELRMRREDGTLFWASASVLAIEGKQQIRITAVDVTDRKEAEQALSVSEERYRAIFTEARDGIALTDAETGAIAGCNPEFERQCGRTLDELKTLKIWDVRPPERREAAKEIWSSVRARGHGSSGDLPIRRPDGQVIEVEFKATLVRFGDRDYVQSIVRDVTEHRRTEEALRASEERARRTAEELRAMIDVVPAAIWIAHDPQCEVITGNAAANLFYEVEEGENVSAGPASGGMQDTTRRFFREGRELKPEELPMQVSAREGVEVRDVEVEVLAPSGRRLTMFGSSVPLGDADGNVRGSVAAFMDVTERRRVDRELAGYRERLEELVIRRTKELADSESSFRGLFTSMMDGAVVVDEAGVVLFANPAARGLWPGAARELVGSHFGVPVSEGMVEVGIPGPDGNVRTIELRGTPAVWSGREGHVIILRDITWRKGVEDELRRSETRVRSLSRRLIREQEAERRTIGRELHDEVGSSLTGLRYQLERLRRDVGEKHRAALKEVDDIVRSVMESVRSLSYSMRPSVLDDLGILEALKWFCDRYTKQTGIYVHFSYAGLERRLPWAVETASYRIVQEALTNVARHAHVKEAWLDARVNGNVLTLSVEDRGRGFDLEESAESLMGIDGMIDRAFLVRGEVTVTSSPGEGTRVECELPVQE